jgi:hypothetical protein
MTGTGTKSIEDMERAYVDVESVPVYPLSLHILDHYSGDPQGISNLFWILNLLVLLLVLPHYCSFLVRFICMNVTIHTFMHFVPYVGKNVIEELHSAFGSSSAYASRTSQWYSPFLVDIPISAVSKCFIYGPHLQQARPLDILRANSPHDSQGIA